jgi:Ca-activated chloride channel family protein
MRMLKKRMLMLRQRRGAISVLVALAIPMLLILAAFAINVAYMQMVREQLRVTCDAAAKAALVKYGSTASQSTAISFAQTVANMNLVAGSPLTLSTSNVIFGNATQGSSGVYAFTAGGTPTNSVQVTGTVNPPLFITTFLPISKFTTTQVSVATRVAYDICLVLDRSASMAFDLSANEFEYPADIPSNAIEAYFTPPSQTASRWYELTLAVNSFISTLQARNINAQVALVTYAETYSFGTYSATEASLDVPLTTNYTAIQTAMNAYSQNPLLGDTNISAGLALAQSELTGSAALPTANRLIILLTDGIATQGNTNIPSITLGYCQNNQIMTDTITFGAEASSGAAQTTMQNSATDGNGLYFNAPTAAQLQTAFQTIADSLPAVLIK